MLRPKRRAHLDALGYSDGERRGAPEGGDSGLGCGNTQAIAELKPGERVLDLRAFDAFLAKRQVGETGRPQPVVARQIRPPRHFWAPARRPRAQWWSRAVVRVDMQVRLLPQLLLHYYRAAEHVPGFHDLSCLNGDTAGCRCPRTIRAGPALENHIITKTMCARSAWGGGSVRPAPSSANRTRP